MTSLPVTSRLLGSLARWVDRAKRDGLSAEQIRMLLEVAIDGPEASLSDDRAAGGVA
jgi:GntR family transcriptional regulator